MVSPFGGWGSTLALLFVLVVAAIKAMWEDLKRHQEDHNTNGSLAHRYMPDGTLPRSSLKLACISCLDMSLRVSGKQIVSYHAECCHCA